MIAAARRGRWGAAWVAGCWLSGAALAQTAPPRALAPLESVDETPDASAVSGDEAASAPVDRATFETWIWVAGGTGVALAAAGAGLWVWGHQEYVASMREHRAYLVATELGDIMTFDAQSRASMKRARALRGSAYGMIGGSVVSLGAAVALFLLMPPDRPSDVDLGATAGAPKVRASVVFTPGGLELGLGLEF